MGKRVSGVSLSNSQRPVCSFPGPDYNPNFHTMFRYSVSAHELSKRHGPTLGRIFIGRRPGERTAGEDSTMVARHAAGV